MVQDNMEKKSLSADLSVNSVSFLKDHKDGSASLFSIITSDIWAFKKQVASWSADAFVVSSVAASCKKLGTSFRVYGMPPQLPRIFIAASSQNKHQYFFVYCQFFVAGGSNGFSKRPAHKAAGQHQRA